MRVEAPIEPLASTQKTIEAPTRRLRTLLRTSCGSMRTAMSPSRVVLVRRGGPDRRVERDVGRRARRERLGARRSVRARRRSASPGAGPAPVRRTRSSGATSSRRRLGAAPPPSPAPHDRDERRTVAVSPVACPAESRRPRRSPPARRRPDPTIASSRRSSSADSSNGRRRSRCASTSGATVADVRGGDASPRPRVPRARWRRAPSRGPRGARRRPSRTRSSR